MVSADAAAARFSPRISNDSRHPRHWRSISAVRITSRSCADHSPTFRAPLPISMRKIVTSPQSPSGPGPILKRHRSVRRIGRSCASPHWSGSSQRRRSVDSPILPRMGDEFAKSNRVLPPWEFAVMDSGDAHPAFCGKKMSRKSWWRSNLNRSRFRKGTS